MSKKVVVMRKKKIYDDDDGRTIADMSEVSRQSLLIPRKPVHSDKSNNEVNDISSQNDKPWEEDKLTKGERFAFAFGAMSAAAVIALIFILGALAVICILYFFGK